MKKIIVIISALIFTAFAVKAQEETKTEEPVNLNGPEITFDKMVHNYGTITKGGNGNCEFTFTNTGNEPLILSNARSS